MKTGGCAMMAMGGPGGRSLPAGGLAGGGAATGAVNLAQVDGVDMMEESC